MRFINLKSYILNLKSTWFFVPYLLFLIVGGTILSLYSKAEILLFINRHNSAAADFFFRYWTNLGLGIMIIPVLLILAFIRFRFVLMSLLSFIIGFSVNDSLKYIFHTPRPVTYFAQIHQTLRLVANVEMYSWNSFPSGHSATGFCMFCLLAIYTKNNGLKVLCFIAALLIAYSRIYLCEHFLGDVYAGSIIGVGSAILSYHIMNARVFNKFAGRLDKPLIPLFHLLRG